jgi:hypothetical protein
MYSYYETRGGRILVGIELYLNVYVVTYTTLFYYESSGAHILLARLGLAIPLFNAVVTATKITFIYIFNSLPSNTKSTTIHLKVSAAIYTRNSTATANASRNTAARRTKLGLVVIAKGIILARDNFHSVGGSPIG